jgi:methyltransferase (TIGR00027 family)
MPKATNNTATGGTMQTGQPSHTARSVAVIRAQHQELEGGSVFRDPLAARVLAPDDEAQYRQLLEDNADSPWIDAVLLRLLRLFVAARARFAEDAVREAVAAGGRQVVVLGAGLDTFAYRNPYEGVRTFEVDHPDTQGWKRARLAEGGVQIPASATFVPLDFERTSLAGGLAAAGFDSTEPGFFIWLGVVPYLTAQAISDTLHFVGSLPAGSEVVCDYFGSADSMAGEARARWEKNQAALADLGEPLVSAFEPEKLMSKAHDHGLTMVENLTSGALLARYAGEDPAQVSRRVGGHIARLRKVGG